MVPSYLPQAAASSRGLRFVLWRFGPAVMGKRSTRQHCGVPIMRGGLFWQRSFEAHLQRRALPFRAFFPKVRFYLGDKDRRKHVIRSSLDFKTILRSNFRRIFQDEVTRNVW